MKTLFDIGDEIMVTLSGKVLEFSASANGDCYTIALTDAKSSETRVCLDSAALRNAVRVDDAKSPSSDSNARLSDLTVNIIALTKRFSGKDLMDAIVKYLSEKYGRSPDRYNRYAVVPIVRGTFMDYLSVADHSRACAAVRRFLDTKSGDDTTRMLDAMREIQIRDISDDLELKCIDGWHDTDFTRKISNTVQARIWLNDAKKEENTNG